MGRGEAVVQVFPRAGAKFAQDSQPPGAGKPEVVAAFELSQVIGVLDQLPRHPAQSDFEVVLLGVAEDAEGVLEGQELVRLGVIGRLPTAFPGDCLGALGISEMLEQ